MKLNNDKIIEIYIKTSYLFWMGLTMVGTLIIMVANGLLDVTMIALTVGMLAYFGLGIVTAVCATTKNRFSYKNIKINIISTSIRIALFVALIIIGITKNTLSSAFGLFVIPIIDVIYLILIIKIKKMTLRKTEFSKTSKVINDNFNSRK